MRAVACTENPEQEFAHLRFLDRRKRDDSASRENLVFGAPILGLPAVASGRIIVFDLMESTSQKHVVLRKPWCPACFATQAKAEAAP